MRIAPRYRGVLVGIAAAILLGSALWLGCGRDGVRSDSTGVLVDTGSPRLPALDKDCNAGEPPVTKPALEACLKHLDFAEEELQTDQQRLMVSDNKPGPACPGAPMAHNCRLGPLGRIQPENHSNQWHDRTIVEEGRIIALLTLDSAGEDYPKLAMFRKHKTYWWVKKGSGGTPGISMYISDSLRSGDSLYYVRKDSLTTYDYRTGSFQHALARWIWVPDDETTKGTCSSSSSCK